MASTSLGRQRALVVLGALGLLLLAFAARPTPSSGSVSMPKSIVGTDLWINVNSGKALEVHGSSTANGGEVDQWTPNGTATQDWNVYATGGSVYEILNANSGKCLEVYDSSTANGGIVDQWSCNGSNTQYWTAVKLGSNEYEFQNYNSGKCLEVYHSGTANGDKVDQWSCNGTATQHWEL